MKPVPAALLVLGLCLTFCTPLCRAQNPEADALRSTLLTRQAETAVKEQKNREAEALFLQATELNSKNGEAWLGLGRLTYAMGDIPRAKNFLKESWACGNATALRILASLAMLEVDYAGFQELIPDLLQKKDSDVEIRAMLVLFYKKAGKMNAAHLDPVLTGLNLNQLKPVSKENLAILLEGYEALGRTTEADAIRVELAGRK